MTEWIGYDTWNTTHQYKGINYWYIQHMADFKNITMNEKRQVWKGLYHTLYNYMKLWGGGGIYNLSKKKVIACGQKWGKDWMGWDI